VSNFTGNVLALLLFTIHDLRNLLNVRANPSSTSHSDSLGGVRCRHGFHCKWMLASSRLQESSEAAKRVKKLEEERKEKARQQATVEAQTERTIISAFEATPEARVARRLKNRNRSESTLQSLKNVANAATSAASNSQAAYLLLNVDRGKLGRAVTFYVCVWLYVGTHLSVIYAVDTDSAREREILMPIGEYHTCMHARKGQLWCSSDTAVVVLFRGTSAVRCVFSCPERGMVVAVVSNARARRSGCQKQRR
jgi:hypothetical protein